MNITPQCLKNMDKMLLSPILLSMSMPILLYFYLGLLIRFYLYYIVGKSYLMTKILIISCFGVLLYLYI
jgi:hypothetical protein